VVYLPYVDGRSAGPLEDFLTGFLDQDENARGRPVGLAIDRTGALLVADDVGGIVWRVLYRDNLANRSIKNSANAWVAAR
jgi:glucose/arabinose dehydrogenase